MMIKIKRETLGSEDYTLICEVIFLFVCFCFRFFLFFVFFFVI